MAVKLNKVALQYAEKLVTEGKVVIDERDAWSEHQPSTEQENEFIRVHGFREYGKWHMGTDDAEDENTKRRYKFPYGDFQKVHRCGVLSVLTVMPLSQFLWPFHLVLAGRGSDAR
jgi:hypothetical protein